MITKYDTTIAHTLFFSFMFLVLSGTIRKLLKPISMLPKISNYATKRPKRGEI